MPVCLSLIAFFLHSLDDPCSDWDFQTEKHGLNPIYGASQVALVVKNPPAIAGDITDAGLIMSDSETLWTAARQAPLFSTVSQSLLRFVSTESMMLLPLSPLPSIFPSIRVFSSESALHIMWPWCEALALASASVLPMNIQGWFPLELTGFISLWSKDSQESSPVPQFKSISSSALSLLYGLTLTCTWLLEKP